MALSSGFRPLSGNAWQDYSNTGSSAKCSQNVGQKSPDVFYQYTATNDGTLSISSCQVGNYTAVDHKFGTKIYCSHTTAGNIQDIPLRGFIFYFPKKKRKNPDLDVKFLYRRTSIPLSMFTSLALGVQAWTLKSSALRTIRIPGRTVEREPL